MVETSFQAGVKFCAANCLCYRLKLRASARSVVRVVTLMATGTWAVDVTLTQLSDSRGETLVQGILRLVDEHDPMQLSLVGGEPMMRHRELSKLLADPERARHLHDGGH